MARKKNFGQTQADIDWVEKQIACLSRQGFKVTEIAKRYPMNSNRIVQIRKKFDLQRRAVDMDADRKYFNGRSHQELTPFITAQPKFKYI